MRYRITLSNLITGRPMDAYEVPHVTVWKSDPLDMLLAYKQMTRTGKGVYIYEFDAAESAYHGTGEYLWSEGNPEKLSFSINAVAWDGPTHGYTFKQLKDAAAHRLGGTPDSRISLGLIVNQAIRRIAKLHSWSWLRAIADLDLTKDSGAIDLPADFGRLDALLATDGSTPLQQVDMDTLVALRQDVPAGCNGYSWCIASGSQFSLSTIPPKALLLAPIPTTNQSGALQVAYQRSLASFPTNDSVTTSDSAYPAIPADVHEALWWMVRAVAAQMEDPQNAAVDWEAARQAVTEQIDEDKRLTPPVARRMAGTIRRGSSTPAYPRNGIDLTPEEE